MPRVDQPCLHIALVPAGPLLDPVDHVAIGLLARGALQNSSLVAPPSETYAEVGIFGHVVRIPPADTQEDFGAEMVGRAAER